MTDAFNGRAAAAAGLLAMAGLAAHTLAGPDIDRSEAPERIAFGSCFNENQPCPTMNAVVRNRPSVFVWLGDNIYGDTEDMDVMRAKYQTLADNPYFAALKNTSPMLAIWDDHDFGVNDGGAEYPEREGSQEAFLDFWEEPEGSERRKTAGIYDAEIWGEPGRRVQFILLDTRYFRSPLVRSEIDAPAGSGVWGRYEEITDTTTTILGEEQWAWLEEQLKEEAELRIIASSIQVIPEDHRWERWSAFPHERRKLFEMLRDADAKGVVFISGDRHRAEISRWDPARASEASGGGIDLGYPVYDVTSSSLNRGNSTFRNEVNRHRVGGLYGPENYGLISVDWDEDDPTVRMQIRSEWGETMIHVEERLSTLHGE